MKTIEQLDRELEESLKMLTNTYKVHKYYVSGLILIFFNTDGYISFYNDNIGTINMGNDYHYKSIEELEDVMKEIKRIIAITKTVEFKNVIDKYFEDLSECLKGE